MATNDPLVTAIDELLPQTQCGLCGFGGCRPYAEALVHQGAEINGCPPGGVKTLNALAMLLKKDSGPYIEEMTQKAKSPSVAVIRESECIGCTKCIQVCPVDAILGSAKRMHTIITQDCTGSELCIEPCPVDCIDMVAIGSFSDAVREEKADYWRSRFEMRQERLAAQETAETALPVTQSKEERITSRKAAIEAALARAKVKADQR